MIGMVSPGAVQHGGSDSRTPSLCVYDRCKTVCFRVLSVCLKVHLDVGFSECVPVCV